MFFWSFSGNFYTSTIWRFAQATTKRLFTKFQVAIK